MHAKIVGVSGHARAGKDTVASRLVAVHGFVRVGFADPMKRFAQEVFDFTDEQVWGSGRDSLDLRYPRSVVGLARGDPYLTARYALQTLGTEWGRDCYDRVWVDYALRVARLLTAEGGHHEYSERRGLVDVYPLATRCWGVVFSDVRFKNEMEAIRESGGLLLRVRRPGRDGAVGLGGHASEAEQDQLPDSYFDHVLENDGTIEQLHALVDDVLR